MSRKCSMCIGEIIKISKCIIQTWHVFIWFFLGKSQILHISFTEERERGLWDEEIGNPFCCARMFGQFLKHHLTHIMYWVSSRVFYLGPERPTALLIDNYTVQCKKYWRKISSLFEDIVLQIIFNWKSTQVFAIVIRWYYLLLHSACEVSSTCFVCHCLYFLSIVFDFCENGFRIFLSRANIAPDKKPWEKFFSSLYILLIVVVESLQSAQIFIPFRNTAIKPLTSLSSSLIRSFIFTLMFWNSLICEFFK